MGRVRFATFNSDRVGVVGDSGSVGNVLAGTASTGRTLVRLVGSMTMDYQANASFLLRRRGRGALYWHSDFDLRNDTTVRSRINDIQFIHDFDMTRAARNTAPAEDTFTGIFHTVEFDVRGYHTVVANENLRYQFITMEGTTVIGNAMGASYWLRAWFLEPDGTGPQPPDPTP